MPIPATSIATHAALLARALQVATDASLTVLSARTHRRSLANARDALFERRQGELGALATWRDAEARVRPCGSPASPAGETA